MVYTGDNHYSSFDCNLNAVLFVTVFIYFSDLMFPLQVKAARRTSMNVIVIRVKTMERVRIK